MSDLPQPLTPPDCDLRGYDYMPLFGHRLFNSDFYNMATDAHFRAAIRLWWAAWQQCPAGSVPDDERLQARLVGVHWRSWRSLAPLLLQSWTKCADGRLYHPLLSEIAKEVFERRQKERTRKANYRKNKDTEVSCPTGQDADGDGDKKDLSHGTSPSCPVLKEKKRKEERKKEGSLRSLDQITLDFEAWWVEYPRKVGKQKARERYIKAWEKVGAERLLGTVRAQRWPEEPSFIPHPATWLGEGRWDDDPHASTPPRHSAFAGKPSASAATLAILRAGGVDLNALSDDDRRLLWPN
jgi:hypothetical protein